MTDDKDNSIRGILDGLGEPKTKPSEGREGTQNAESDVTTEEQSGEARKRPLEPHERGKRNRPGMKQVVGSVPHEVRAEVFYYLKQESEPGAKTTMSDLIEKLLTDWLKKKRAEKGKA